MIIVKPSARNDFATAEYTEENFLGWVWEVLQEGYKHDDAKKLTLAEAIQLAETSSFVIETKTEATEPAPKKAKKVRPTKPTIVRITTKLGEVFVGEVHGSGGRMTGDDTLKRLRFAQERADKGEDIGIYEPQPGHVRMYVEDDQRVDVDLRGATIVGKD